VFHTQGSSIIAQFLLSLSLLSFSFQEGNMAKSPTGPSIEDEIRKAGAPKGSALEKLIRENQDYGLLAPEELTDDYPLPLWLRVLWRKQHPEIPMPAKNPGAAYPEVLSQIHRRMVANPNQPWGSNATTGTPSPPSRRR